MIDDEIHSIELPITDDMAQLTDSEYATEVRLIAERAERVRLRLNYNMSLVPHGINEYPHARRRDQPSQ